MSFTPTSLRDKFEECLTNDDLSDCEFLVGKRKCRIKGHRLLFGVSSPVFRDLLYADSKNVSTFKIADVEADEFNCMKQFFYTDSIDFTSCLHACLVYLASWRYVVPDLMTKCVKYIRDNISASEVIEVYEFSRHNNTPDIETICSAVFQDKTRDVMESEQFLSADIHTLETILKLDTVKLRSELEVFKFAEKWVRSEVERKKIGSEQLREYFDPIIKQIRFLTMNRDQYQQGPYVSDLLTDAEKLFIAHSLLGLENRSTQKCCAETKHRVFTEVGEGEKEEEEEDKRRTRRGSQKEKETKKRKKKKKKGEEEEEKEVVEEGVNEEEEVENREGADKKDVEKREDKDRDGIVHNQVENLQQSVSQKSLPNNAIKHELPTNAETFKFHFSCFKGRYIFKYQGLDFEIYYSEKIKSLKTVILSITLVNRNNYMAIDMLHSVGKIKIRANPLLSNEQVEKKFNLSKHPIAEIDSFIENYKHTFTYKFDYDFGLKESQSIFNRAYHFELTLFNI